MPEERQPYRTIGEDDYEEVAIAKETRVLLKCIMNHRAAVNLVPTQERGDVMHLCNEAEHWLGSKIL